MLGLIIYGTRGIKYKHREGQFFCPACHEQQAYVHRRVRRFFTLYFIPLIPLTLAGEYIECQRCTGTFKLEVLQLPLPPLPPGPPGPHGPQPQGAFGGPPGAAPGGPSGPWGGAGGGGGGGYGGPGGGPEGGSGGGGGPGGGGGYGGPGGGLPPPA
jgi:zinc-ribbon family